MISADPRLLGALRKTVSPAGGRVRGRWNEMHLSVFHSVSNCAHGKRSRNSLFRGSVRFQLVFFPQTRDCTTFMLHDLTDFYVEMVTVHRIKINDHSCFHNSWPNSKTKLKLKHLCKQGGPLVFRGPYAACIFCVLGGSALPVIKDKATTCFHAWTHRQTPAGGEMHFCKSKQIEALVSMWYF